MNRPGVSLDVSVGGQVHAKFLHGVHVGRISKQGPNVFGKAESHKAPRENNVVPQPPTECTAAGWSAGALYAYPPKDDKSPAPVASLIQPNVIAVKNGLAFALLCGVSAVL